MTCSIDHLLRPNAVAIVGASDNADRIGGRPIQYMLNAGFRGRLYAVNPGRKTVQGLQAYPDIASVPEVIDCAIISVPANSAVRAIRECAEHGVKSVLVFTSGFAEMSESGAVAQRELEAIAQSSGMRILGPNCLGVFHVGDGWFGTFANAPAMIKVPSGSLGIVSQSGAYGAHVFLVSQLRGVGASYWVTTGNECDVNVAEIIEYYAHAPDVRVILAYAEGTRNGNQMALALESARAAQKPVIFLKAGRTRVGAQAAASHTASLAGTDAIYDALFRQYGVYRAETTEEMVDVAYACQFGRLPTGGRISLQTISGGVGIQMADACERYGLEVEPLPAAAQRVLKELIPFGAVRNPVDFTAQALDDPELMRKTVSLTIDHGDYDSCLIYLSSVPASETKRQACLDIFSDLRRKYPDEVVALTFIGPDAIKRPYELLGFPCFEDPYLAVRAIAALTHFGRVFSRGPSSALIALPAGVLPVPRVPASEHQAKRVLASAGIPVIREMLVGSADEAVEAWKSIGGPVVMKIASPDIAHKTEIGGVLLRLNDERAIVAGYATLLERAKVTKPQAQVDGVVVGEMIVGGVETVIGVISDPVFGPAVMFGLGGVFVEILKDVTFRLAPFAIDEAYRMIDEIKGRAMLDGVRGARPADVAALADALSRLSVYAADNADTIQSIDINPFIVLPVGAVAVDALIEPAQRQMSGG